jgi:hypothetical protein
MQQTVEGLKAREFSAGMQALQFAGGSLLY